MRRLLDMIVVMLLFTSLTLAIGINASEPQSMRNIVYVNNDNVAGPWNGSDQNPYRLIQDAIDHAGTSDIVLVANGTYYEHLIIPSQLNYLKIDYWNNPPIEVDSFLPQLYGNGTGTGISIHASDVIISQMTITNYGKEGRDACIYVETTANGVQITNNIISFSYHGIWIKRDVPGETNHLIKNNVITNITQRGISLVLCDSNKIQENTIKNCTWGVYLHDCYKNDISENLLENNTEGLVIDIGIENRVISNNFIENKYGFGTVGTRSSTINKNNFIDNSISDAYFITFNVWNADVWSGNYWGRLVFPLMKPIPGSFVLAKINLPWIKFDFFPSESPN